MTSTATELVVTNNFRKFLFWFRYDGSKFVSMAKGADSRHGPSVIQLVEACLHKTFGREHLDRIKTFIVSRTDAKVHAIRTPIFVGLPGTCEWFNQSELTRANFLNYFNGQIQRFGYENAIELLRVDPVAMGFHPSFHVAYRRYVYRLRVISTEQSSNYPDRFFTHLFHLIPPNPSLETLAEFNYSWTIPPTFSLERAQLVCDLLRKPGQNFASFFMHQMRQRKNEREYRSLTRRNSTVMRILKKYSVRIRVRLGEVDADSHLVEIFAKNGVYKPYCYCSNYMSVTRRRQLMLLQIKKGEPYHDSAEDEAQFYNLDFVAHGFMRQQIRRMVALIVKIACDTSRGDPGKLYEFLFKDPDPLRFHQAGLVPAPSSGLFLADVVYNTKMFTNPVPEFFSSWETDDMNYIDERECPYV